MVLSVYYIFLVCIVIGKIKAQNYYVATPKVLRLNSDETVGVAVDGNLGGVVNIYVQDHPGKATNITQTSLIVNSGKPALLKIRLDTENFPSGFLSTPGLPKYVSLTASFQGGNRKELLIPISNQYGYMFIQTDKPIYTPKDRALFRIIPLNEDSLPSHETFQLQIKNPNDTIVEQKLFEAEKLDHSKAFVTHVYKFPTHPVLGEWSATVQYGYDLKQNTTVRFQLKEYVLPMFSVELETPDIILPTDDVISIKVSAKYVYGKKVQGVVSFRLGLRKPSDLETKFFAVINANKLVDGSFNLRLTMERIMNNANVASFSQIQNTNLVVEALVVDAATGNEEEVVDMKTLFTDTPFIISFKRSLEDFRPGHTSVIEADISYVNGKPAVGIMTVIEAKDINRQPLELKQISRMSDEEGKVSFEVRTQLDHKIIFITLRAIDKGFEAEASFQQRAFQSSTNSYIALDRLSQTLKPGDAFKRIIHYEPNGLNNIYYLITTKGKIIMMNKLPDGRFGDQHVSFTVTHDMVPSFRILIFAHHHNQVLVDSLKFNVENECNPQAEVSIHPEYSIQEPGHSGKIIVRGNGRGTYVGLLGVDEAVYALSKKDILTKAKIFNRLASHDLGCGPGGGSTVNDVLGKAGIVLGTNTYSPLHTFSCTEHKRRRKREVVFDIVNMYNGYEKECCSLGVEHDIHYRSCEERATIVEQYLKNEEYLNCSKVFLDCCLYTKRKEIQLFLESSVNRGYSAMTKMFENTIGLTEIDPDIEHDIESKLVQRSYFPETWIFQDVIIGPDNKEEISANLPHSITTWVIHAVSVSPTHGICIAEPKKIVSFQKIFLHLNLPYSVVRNEQVEIQATVFNYDERPLRAVVYMYGAEGLCSSTQPDQKSERQHVTIEGHSAATVVFPVMPLKAEVIPIRVVALSALGSDVILKELNVVPEGITKEINIPITLDPTNLQKRKKRGVEKASYLTDYIDPTQKSQATTVKLDVCLPEDFIPGTESCTISAIGDAFGPAVQTTINNPEGLLREPTGCGEQNMVKLAPTLYAMRYLKITGKLTADTEDKGYSYMRQGYGNQLEYRKNDGSYAAFKDRSTNTWLTAFVMKVFCQAADLIYIDENVMCSGVKWLIDNQQADGSYDENYPLYSPELMTGMHKRVPLTAFVLIALEECKCDTQRLTVAKRRAEAYLEDNINSVHQPLPAAIVAYALSLSGSDLMSAANDKLMRLAKYDEETNRMYWITEDSAHDIQTAGYALLTQLLFNDMQRSTSIVNWLNTKQLGTGGYESTQDTMIALQAMSEYAIKAQMPPINLVTKITSNNDRFSERQLVLNDQNSQILQGIKMNKVGGTLLISTTGEGTGSMSINLRYNVIVPPEDICKFDIHVNVTDTKPEEIFGYLRNQLNSGSDVPIELQSNENHKLKYRISICVRYLGDKDTDMSIVDVGIFSGFQPVNEDLLKIESDVNQLIQKTEISKRGVVFYLAKIPFADKYCFNFRVFRQYIVGNTQMSYIKVYDYYNPDATCTKSYKPISNSPVIRALCEGGICQCAEGGCPSEEPFSDIKDMKRSTERRNVLKEKFCEDFDYVWKGRVHYIRKEGGFFNISFTVNEVIKAGIEKPELIEGEKRTLLAKSNCMTAALNYGTSYLILGKDGEGYENEFGQIWYRYILDQSSIVQRWTSDLKDLKNRETRDLQRALNHVTRILKEEGCDM